MLNYIFVHINKTYVYKPNRAHARCHAVKYGSNTDCKYNGNILKLYNNNVLVFYICKECILKGGMVFLAIKQNDDLFRNPLFNERILNKLWQHIEIFNYFFDRDFSTKDKKFKIASYLSYMLGNKDAKKVCLGELELEKAFENRKSFVRSGNVRIRSAVVDIEQNPYDEESSSSFSDSDDILLSLQLLTIMHTIC